MSNAIGILELSSIAAGFKAQDTMLKAADVELILARTICSGKYLIIVGGSVSSVTAALDAGSNDTAGYLIEKLNIPNIDRQVFAALSNTVPIPEKYNRALGIVETFSATPIIEAADAAVKAADVTLFRVHVSMAIGGKGFMLLCGDVASVEAAVSSAIEMIKESGMLVNSVVIPAASKELFKEYI
ncbi:MAG: BMC domain-containing protein [Deltaproteobacteria bacterium]|jgi:microcompartment protein CcmL/EutN|nr:BMC domain-containing protein [Deltaproteobacteria bacterium]MBT4527144.1 BMC domain-containing protein [Deltaproteobacteria bacterium]